MAMLDAHYKDGIVTIQMCGVVKGCLMCLCN